MAEVFPGHCACGEVTFELTAEPMFVNCCHCLDCQRETGSAFVLNGLIEASELKLVTGEPVPVVLPADSGRPHDVYRCPNCQTALWSDYGRRGYLLFVRLGVLDDPARFRPDAHVFTRSRLPWVKIPPDQPAFEIFYDMKELWPAEALARRQAASDAATAGGKLAIGRF